MGRYYWVVDYKQSEDEKIHPVIIGGRAFSSEVQAQRYMDDASLSRHAEIMELLTSSTSAATQEIKAILVKRYKSLDKGMTRAVHK